MCIYPSSHFFPPLYPTPIPLSPYPPTYILYIIYKYYTVHTHKKEMKTVSIIPHHATPPTHPTPLTEGGIHRCIILNIFETSAYMCSCVHFSNLVQSISLPYFHSNIIAIYRYQSCACIYIHICVCIYKYICIYTYTYILYYIYFVNFIYNI